MLAHCPTFGYTLLGVVNFKIMIQIQDDYRHLKFKQPTSISELKVGHYLKLTNKGAHVETYEEISKEEVPQKALEKLE